MEAEDCALERGAESESSETGESNPTNAKVFFMNGPFCGAGIVYQTRLDSLELHLGAHIAVELSFSQAYEEW